MKDFIKSPISWRSAKKEKRAEAAIATAAQLEMLGRVDRLAMQRTLLANERTLLAYVRTSVSLVLLGAALVQFFTHRSFLIMGIIFVALGVAVMFYGFKSHLQRQEKITNS